jgi:glutamate-1-semialdehyde 2,1-aminomutase
MTHTLGRSNALFETAQTLFPGGVNSPVRAFRSVGSTPFFVQRGEGPYLFDVDGNRYVDYVLSWGPLVLGHAPKVVQEAIRQQASLGTTYGAPCEAEMVLAEAIRAAMPSLEMLRFVSSGTEAGMSVLRLARAYTGRSKILKFRGCYHGHADPLLVQSGSGVLTLGLPDSPGVPREVVSHTLTASFNDIDSVHQAFHLAKDEIAAVIVEPVVGNAGFIPPNESFLHALREITTANGSLLIFDEVMTGFRVHRGGAQALFGITPDLTMLAKVIGGGLPAGAFGGRAEIMRLIAPLGPVYQAGTLSGNPLAMVAGSATLREWLSGDIFDRTARSATTLTTEIERIARTYDIPLTASSLGTMFGFFFRSERVQRYEDALQADLTRFNRFFHLMLERGVFFAPSQFEAGFLSSMHEGEPLDHTIATIEEVCRILAAE